MGPPDIRFSRGTTRLMSWPDGERYLCHLQSLVVSLLLSLVSTLVFSRTGGVLFHRDLLTHRFPRFSPRNLCFLVTLAVFSLVLAATDTVSCLVLISVGLAESRILSAAPANTRPRTPLISFCTALSSYGLFARLTFWQLSVSLRPLVQALVSFSASGAPWSSAMPLSLGRSRVTNNNNNRFERTCTPTSEKLVISLYVQSMKQ